MVAGVQIVASGDALLAPVGFTRRLIEESLAPTAARLTRRRRPPSTTHRARARGPRADRQGCARRGSPPRSFVSEDGTVKTHVARCDEARPARTGSSRRDSTTSRAGSSPARRRPRPVRLRPSLRRVRVSRRASPIAWCLGPLPPPRPSRRATVCGWRRTLLGEEMVRVTAGRTSTCRPHHLRARGGGPRDGDTVPYEWRSTGDRTGRGWPTLPGPCDRNASAATVRCRISLSARAAWPAARACRGKDRRTRPATAARRRRTCVAYRVRKREQAGAPARPAAACRRPGLRRRGSTGSAERSGAARRLEAPGLEVRGTSTSTRGLQRVVERPGRSWTA